MRNAMMQHGAQERGEVIQTEDPYKAIVAIANRWPVIFTYDAHYNCYIRFDAIGRIHITDQDLDYELRDDPKVAIEDYAYKMNEAAQFVRKARKAVPSGNLMDFGGVEGVAKKVFDVLRIKAYIGAFESMPPDQQDGF